MSGDGLGAISVSELTQALRNTLEQTFPYVWVQGEVTNFVRAASGHCYFGLKDDNAILRCVWFRHQQKQETFDPLTGEVLDAPALPARLANGQNCVCAGRIGIYAQRGEYQLQVDFVRQAGMGSLAQAFEERKRSLAAAGYFAQERKRPLPANPGRIALVTSPGGAAIHDFLEIASQRGSGAQIRLYPALVQGREAASDIVRAIRTINAHAWAEVIVLVRGGGSLEDLWCFNEQIVADAVFASAIPVLAGIGHEIDFTLADLTADRRAATPSHAAQLLWPPRSELAQNVDDAALRLHRAMKDRLGSMEAKLKVQERALAWFSPQGKIARLTEKFIASHKNLHRVARQWLAMHEHRLALAMPALAALNPLAPLGRGYAIVECGGKILRGVGDLEPDAAIDVRLADGTITAAVTGISRQDNLGCDGGGKSQKPSQGNKQPGNQRRRQGGKG